MKSEINTGNTNQKKILIMDDDEQIRSIMRVMLNHLGFDSIVTSEGKQALDEYTKALNTKAPFNLVILDLIVEDNAMGGKEAAQKILEIDNNAKIIISSGSSHEAMSIPGITATLSKPFRLNQLEEVIKNSL